jgi:hypothetical protein
MSFRRFVTVLALPLAACVASPSSSDVVDEYLTPQIAPATPVTPVAPVPPPVAESPEPQDTTIHYLNLAFEVADPIAAMDQARKAVEENGGIVTNAYSSGDTANLAGRIAADQRGTLRDRLLPLAGRVTSENMSSNDMGHELRRLRGQTRKIANAERELFGANAGASAETLSFVRELLDRERQNVDAQLSSYRDQLGAAHVNVSFTTKPR